ncbi:UNVERIFIED_CONTAM: hypothetical protein Slati_4438600 [Sesamum latifolium]|uniref:Uncharacterized protein n=1 Tax=Sesamum latifolium TaxID=2727402 RepID=A0AAW2SQK9_9LAMI
MRKPSILTPHAQAGAVAACCLLVAVRRQELPLFAGSLVAWSPLAQRRSEPREQAPAISAS